MKNEIKFRWLTSESWKDFELLFGQRGACGGCWCMNWRIKKSEFEKNKGATNKKLMKNLVDAGEEIGLIAYIDGKPAAWCSVAPREKFCRLENSRVLARIDDQQVWSIVCFFISKEFRKMGLSSEVLKGVIKHCKKIKVKILEGYPVEPYSKNMPAAFAWTGFPSAFIKAGFKEAARRSKSRPIMRYNL